MRNRLFAFGLCFLVICSGFIPISLGCNVKVSNIEKPSLIGRGKTLYVGGIGPDNYTKIQDAIDDAVDADTVFVYDYSSPYYELLVINKSINLVGEDRDSTVIDGNYKGTVVDIQADGVTVSGFTLLYCKKLNAWDYNVVQIINCDNVLIEDNLISVGPQEYTNWRAGVYLKDSSNNIIQDNIIYEGGSRTTGIALYDNSSFNNVSGNEIYGYVDGIYLFSKDNVIYGNNIHHNTDGISNNGDNNKIINNIVTNNPSEGIRNGGVSNTLISGNSVKNNGNGGEFDNGIVLVLGSNNQVINNHISNNNPTGIFLLSTENNYITDNHISDNKLGLYSDYGRKSVISRNNFIGNPTNAYFETTSFLFYNNRWIKNYWDDYRGKGVYFIQGRVYFLILFSFAWFNIDWFPAKEPYVIEV